MILKGNLFSQELEMETSISILSSDNKDSAPYRVIYLLHGLCGRSGDWIDYTMLPVFAKEYNAIFIMPEVARSFYSDMKFGLNYFTYITEELPQICKKTFNISQEKKDTYIIGASMGGYGALKCALSKPENYNTCCAFSSPCLFLKDDLERSNGALKFRELYGESLFNDFQAIFGEDIQWNSKDDVIELARRLSKKTNKPRIYLSCGKDDFLLNDNRRYYKILKDLDYDIEFNELEGNHNWQYFNETLEHSLKYCFPKDK
ncbi:alpha/beta hydrolase family protein [Labilibaculum sp. K2S]|uniref:alpha/beta hydrolase n=1 Tax=Labilibaculum sp. K2S TaxID=3056386 RepID=UPI0025A4C351|nr:alpha/beta hydrolase family protein [Labilibaculum sp. K2S]MDM8162109.1 alpha/beta hydrolase family protein [Labilibaculum sp. K2S]